MRWTEATHEAITNGNHNGVARSTPPLSAHLTGTHMKLAIALLMFTISIFADSLLGSVYAQDDVASKKSNKIAAELNAAVDDYRV